MADVGRLVVRYDSIPLNKTYFTKEGYLIDHPVVTTVGIFEYHNPDGSIRRELRLPEEVFAEKSLKTYKGKPVIITHDAGEIDKDNVAKEEIGTILSDGNREGNEVKAEIIIHDTDKMKKSGLKELSLGYSLRLDETSGEWNGEHYDAIQRDIEINHLALVSAARAGENARLNIDGKNSEGGLKMLIKRRHDAGDPLADAVEKFKAEHEEEDVEGVEGEENINETENVEDIEKVDEEGTENEVPEDIEKKQRMALLGDEDEVEEVEETEEEVIPEEKPEVPVESDEDIVKGIRVSRDRRDAEGDPQDLHSAMGVIARQDEDIDKLLAIVEKMKAKRDFDSAESEGNKMNLDKCGGKKVNMDSVDKIVSQKLELCRLGDKLRLDGIEKMSILNAKKAIINKIKPNLRLDGKTNVYIDAMFDIAKDEITSQKRATDLQRKEMFNNDARDDISASGAAQARARMIERHNI